MMNVFKNLLVHPLGDHAITIQLSEEIDNDIHQFILQTTKVIEAKPFTGFIEVIPSYHNFTVFFDPLLVYEEYKDAAHFSPFEFVKEYCIRTLKRASDQVTSEKNIIEIPVLYGKEHVPDLSFVASYDNIDPDEVIQLHSE